MSGNPAGIPLSKKGLSDPADGQNRASREKGLAGVPPTGVAKRRPRIPKGYNQYVTSLYQEEDYQLRHLDCGEPPDGRIFVAGIRTTDDLLPRRDRVGQRLESAYIDDDSEAWSPPDTLMEDE